MKLVSCHHIKKRPPKGGGNSGELFRQDDMKSRYILRRRKRRRCDCCALINANSINVKPSVSLNCCYLVRCSHSVYHFKRVFKTSLLVSLMCLIIISDFQQDQQQQFNQQIAKKCAQSDSDEEVESQYNNNNNNNKELMLNSRYKQQHEYISSLINESSSIRELRSIRTTGRTKNEHQAKYEYDLHKPSTCSTSNKLWPSLSLTNLFWPKNGLVLFAQANVDANRLYEDLMMTYNRIVLPVQNNTDRVVVKLALKLSQLIDVVSNQV